MAASKDAPCPIRRWASALWQPIQTLSASFAPSMHPWRDVRRRTRWSNDQIDHHPSHLPLHRLSRRHLQRDLTRSTSAKRALRLHSPPLCGSLAIYLKFLPSFRALKRAFSRIPLTFAPPLRVLALHPRSSRPHHDPFWLRRAIRARSPRASGFYSTPRHALSHHPAPHPSTLEPFQ